jgi:phage-related protein (TIGR01555 family)
MTDQMLSNLFIGNSIARKIISLPADEAVKNWICIDDDPESKPVQILDDMGAESHFADALRWGRLYGGSVILMLANDGGTLEDPLKEGNVKEVESIRVYDKTQVFWNDAVLYEDPRNKQYGEPEYYQISPVGGMPFLVHQSRLLLFKGDPLPDYYRLCYQGWGLPSLQGLWDELLNNSHAHSLAIKIMERMSQGVLKLDGMLGKLETDFGEAEIKKRLELIDMARSILNTIAIDKEDDFEIKSVSLAQIPELLDRFGLAVSAASNIPFTWLFGRSPAGMNATGESDSEIGYNFVKQIQKRQLKPQLSRLIRLISSSKEANKLTFMPLWLPSDKEQAETDKLKAEAREKEANTANIYVGMRLLTRQRCARGLLTARNMTLTCRLILLSLHRTN